MYEGQRVYYLPYIYYFHQSIMINLLFVTGITFSLATGIGTPTTRTPSITLPSELFQSSAIVSLYVYTRMVYQEGFSESNS